MPIYITQGRYTRDAVKGMIVKPEDRADAVGRMVAKAGGKLRVITSHSAITISSAIAEMPSDIQIAAVLLAAASGGRHRLRTTVAHDLGRGKGAFAAASDFAPGFKSAGGT